TGRWSLLFLPVRLAVLIQLKASLKLGLLIFISQLERFFLPLDRLGEFAGFGVSGGECFQRLAVFPLGQLAGLRCTVDGLLAVAIIVVRTSCPKHGAGVVSDRVSRIEPNGLGEVGQRIVVKLEKVTGIAAIVVGD